MRASRLAEPVIRRPRLVLFLALAVTFAAVFPALRFRVDTDLSALLPDGSPGADDYRLFLRTFGGFEKVFVLVRSARGPLADPAPLIDAAELIAEQMGRSPLVAEARSGITEEDERFFLAYLAPRMPLLMDGDVRRELAPRLRPEAIRERVALMRQTLRSPAGSALSPLFAADPIGLSEGLAGAASAALPIDPITGAFVSRKGDAALVILTPARAEIDPEGGKALLADLDRAYAQARQAVDVPLELAAVGGPIYAAQDEALLRADLSRTAITSAAGVAILLLIGFGGGFIPLVILASVVAGLVWTAAATALWLGSISVIGVGFAAALIGMGVEYGIHGGARFQHLRFEGVTVAEALRETFSDPGPGVFSSALTTAAGLGALVLAHFRPLRELGQALTVGVLATLVTTATLGAALLVLFPGGVRTQRQAWVWRRWGYPALQRTVGFAARRPALVLGLAALLSAVSLWGVSRLDLSTDLRSLRPKDHPSARAERLLVETFAVGLDTLSVVAQGKTLDQALDRAALARQVLGTRLGAKAEITSPSDWLVLGSRRQRRLGELRALPLSRAADDFERELVAAGFRPEPFASSLAALKSLSRGEDPGAPPAAEWPRWVRELIRKTASGETAVAVHVRVPLGSAGPESAEELARALREASPGLALASVPRVGAELRGLALGDLKRSSAVALALVALVVLVSVGGRLGDSLLSGLPLALGCLWGFGLWGAFGGHVDVLAISTLPVLFGTGIDLGVHAVHGGRLRPEEGIRGTVERSGLAMLLIALTTGIGFGSLGSSRVPGLQNAGTLVAVGVTACLIATFLVLPAVEALSLKGRMRENPPINSEGVSEKSARELLTPLPPSPIALPPDRERGENPGGGAPLPGEGSAMGEGTGVRSRMAVASTRATPDVPPHAPEPGWMRRVLGPFYITGVFWFRLHRWGVRRLPPWSLAPLIALFATFFWLVLRNIRAAIGSNLEAVLGPCGWLERQRRMFRTLHTFSWCLSERYERLSTDRPFAVDVDGAEHLRELNAAGTGFLMVTAHLGAWEVGSTLASFDSPRRVHVVRESETDPRAQQFISELIRKRAGDLYTTHFAEDPQLGVDLLDALRRGEVVALQGDRPRSGGRTAEISLFGRPYAVPVGPVALARAAEAPILPVFVFREGGKRYQCALRPPIYVADTGNRRADLASALQRFAVELEWAIRHRPHQWFCFRKLWHRVEVGADQAEQQLEPSPQAHLVNR